MDSGDDAFVGTGESDAGLKTVISRERVDGDLKGESGLLWRMRGDLKASNSSFQFSNLNIVRLSGE